MTSRPDSTRDTAELDAALAHARDQTGLHWQAVCVARADAGHRATDVLGLAAGAATALAAAALLPVAEPSGESWDGPSANVHRVLVLALGLLGGLLGAAIAGRWPALRQKVTPPRFRARAATAAAQRALHAGPPVTPRVLVYAALTERRVVVLAQAGDDPRFTDPALATLCRLVADQLTRDSASPLAALARGVRAAADHLTSKPLGVPADPPDNAAPDPA